MIFFGFFRRTTASSDPGGFAISHDKLKVLRPDLYPRNGFRAWLLNRLFNNAEIRSIQDQLKNGDACAAIVVMLYPLLVAAYTDELGCVAVLEFPESFVEQYGLSERSRLLTINQYRQDASFDDDLVAGPDQTNRWRGFCPVIADFVTDDLELLKDHKHQIPESEWNRALLMGKDYLRSHPGVARGGRPGQSQYSETPAKVRWLVISLLMCIAGMLTERWAAGEFLKKRAIESWPITNGIVQKSEVQSESIGKYHTAKIQYEYSVAKKPYSSSSVRVGGTTFDSKYRATEITKRFPLNSQVSVYYNLNQPSESFLEARIQWTDYVLITSPAVYSLLWGTAFCVIFQSRWQFRRVRRERLDKILGKRMNSDLQPDC